MRRCVTVVCATTPTRTLPGSRHLSVHRTVGGSEEAASRHDRSAEVLHVWFARDKGANYGFCEVASQEVGMDFFNVISSQDPAWA